VPVPECGEPGAAVEPRTEIVVGQAKRKQDRKKSTLVGRAPRREIFERIRASTAAFAIHTHPNPISEIVGSGVVVHKSGIVATAKHVLEGINKRIDEDTKNGVKSFGHILLPGAIKQGDENGGFFEQRHEAARWEPGMRVSTRFDVGLVRLLPGKHKLVPARMNVDHPVYEGDPVATCGWPYGLQANERKTILSSFLVGTVSTVVPHPVIKPSDRIQYQVQLPVNPGNSGGPVFDPDTGDVYGVVCRRWLARGIPTGIATVEPLSRIVAPMEDWLSGG